MAVGYNPSIVLDGLTFLMDAQSEKGFGTDDFTKARTRIIDNPGDRDAGEDVIVKHSQGPFPGAGYVTFDGTDDYLRISSGLSIFSFNTTPFTIEAWIYPTSLPSSEAMICSFGGNVYGWASDKGYEYTFYIDSNGALKSNLYDGSTSFNSIASSTGQISVNTWQHVALCGNGSTTKIFINGVEKGSVNEYPRTITSPAYFTIGSARPQSNSTSDFSGYISNFRVIKGTALYTSGFTPAGNLLTAVTNTKLLTCQKSTITDASSSGNSITVIGDPTAVYPSLGSYVFDGNQGSRDQKIQFSSSLFNSNLNFTLSMWYEASSTSDLISNTSGAGLSVELGTRVMIQEPYGGGQLTYTAGSSTIVSLDQIYNVVITRNGQTTTSFSIFVNGEEVSVSNINNGGSEIFSQHPNVIGSRYNGGFTPAAHFQGKLYHMCAYQRVLTDSEIRQNFNALKGRYGV
jgi:hypothetical protein